MRLFKENLLVQFSTVSFVVMLTLAVAISMVLTTKLDNNIEKLKDHGAAMMAGQMIKPTDNFSIPSLTPGIQDLQWTTFGAVGAGFMVLYASLVTRKMAAPGYSIICGASCSKGRPSFSIAPHSRVGGCAPGEITPTRPREVY